MARPGRVIERMINKIRKTESPQKSKKASDVSAFSAKVYVKAIPLRSIGDIDIVKEEVKLGNILIIRVSPLAKKSIEDVKQAVNELCEFVESIGGDIARLGEERVVVTPSSVRIWRDKTTTLEKKAPIAA